MPEQPESNRPDDGHLPPGNEGTAHASDGVHQKTWVELARMSQQAFFNRRNVEFKTLFGLLTGLGLLTWAVITNATALQGLNTTAVAAWYFILWLILLFCWQCPIRRGFEDDKRFKHFFQSKAARLPLAQELDELRLGAPALIGLTEPRHLTWTVSQMAVLGLFMIISWQAICTAISNAKTIAG